ncbi:hypothetical protein D3C80_778430 [compost metagenome]
MLNRDNVVLQVVVPEVLGHGEDSVRLGDQLRGLYRVDRLLDWNRSEGLSNGNDAALNRAYDAGFSNTLWQDDYQRVAGSARNVVVHGDAGRCRRFHSATERCAGEMLICHSNDVARSANRPIQPNTEADGAGFKAVGQQDVLAGPLRLTLGNAAKRGYLSLAHTVANQSNSVLYVLDALVAEVLPVSPGHFRDAEAGGATGTCSAELAVDDVGVGVGVHRVRRHVSRAYNFVCGVVAHAAEHAGQVLQHGQRFGAGLQVDVAGESWLLSALPVRHGRIAVLGDLVQAPLVDLALIDEAAQAVSIIQDNVAPDPWRAVGPCGLERTVPGAGISPGVRVVVGRDLNNAATDPVGPLRHRGELARVDLQAAQCGVRVLELGVDDLRIGAHRGLCLDVGGLGVRSGAAYPDSPACLGRRQVYANRTLVAASGLAVEGALFHHHIVAVIGGQIDLVVDLVTYPVAVAFRLDQRPHRQLNAHRRQFQVAERLNPWLGCLELNAYTGLGLDGWEASDMILIMLAGALLPGDAGEVQAAITVRQGSSVEVNGLRTIHQSNDRALAQPIEDVRVAGVDQAVRAFDRSVRLGPAFGAQDRQIGHGYLYCWSSA